MKSAIDWLINKSSAIVGKNEEALVSPSHTSDADSCKFESNVSKESSFNGYSNERVLREWAHKPGGSRDSHSPWGRSLTPKSPKYLSEKITRGMAHASISDNNRSNLILSRNNSSTSWEDLSFASEVTSPGFTSRICKEATQNKRLSDSSCKYPIGQERFIRSGVLPKVRLKGQPKHVIIARRAPSSPLVPLATSPFSSSSSGFLSTASTRMPDISSVVSILESTPSGSAFESIKDPTSVQAVVAALEQAQTLKSGVKRSIYDEAEDSNKKHKFMNESNTHDSIPPIYSTPKATFCFSSGTVSPGGEKRALDLSPPSSNEKTQLSPENKRRCIPDPRIASLSSSKHIGNKTLSTSQSSGRETPFSMYDSHQDSDSESNKSMESSHSKQSDQSFRAQASVDLGRLSNHDGSHSPQSNAEGSSSSSRTATPSRPSHAFSLEAYKAQKAKSQQRLNKMLGMLFNVSEAEAEASIKAQKGSPKKTISVQNTLESPTVAFQSVPDPSSKIVKTNADISASFTFTVKPPSSTQAKAAVDDIKTSESSNSIGKTLSSSSSLTDLLSKGHKLDVPLKNQLPKSPSSSLSSSLLPKSLSFLSPSPNVQESETFTAKKSVSTTASLENSKPSDNLTVSKSPSGFKFGATLQPFSSTTNPTSTEVKKTGTSTSLVSDLTAQEPVDKPTTSSSDRFSFDAATTASETNAFSFSKSSPEQSLSLPNPLDANTAFKIDSFSTARGTTTVSTSSQFSFGTNNNSSCTTSPSSSGGGLNLSSSVTNSDRTTGSPFTFGSQSATYPTPVVSKPNYSKSTKEFSSISVAQPSVSSTGTINTAPRFGEESTGVLSASSDATAFVLPTTSANPLFTFNASTAPSSLVSSESLKVTAQSNPASSFIPTFGSSVPSISSTNSFGSTSLAAPTTFGSHAVAPFGQNTTENLASNVVTTYGTSTTTATPFTFGQNAPVATTTFGSTSTAAGPTFGSSSTSAEPTFGSSSTSAGPTFGSSSTSAGPTFGSSSTSAGPTFGSSITAAGPTFGSSSSTAVGPTFGSSSTSVGTTFGSSSAAAGPTFGSNSAAIGPTFGSNFGNSAQSAAAALGTNSGGFSFSAKGTNASTTGGFTFGGTTSSATNVPSTVSSGKQKGGFDFGSALTGPATTTSSSSIFTFGNSTKPSENTSSNTTSFGEAPKSTNSSFGVGFSGSSDKGVSKSLFGAKESKAVNLFGSDTAQSAFGSSVVASSSVFGVSSLNNSTATTTAAPPPPYGSSAASPFGTSLNPPPAFGSSSISSPTFGKNNLSNATFSSNPAPSFGNSNVSSSSFGSSNKSNAPTAFGASSANPVATFGGSATGSLFGNPVPNSFEVSNPTFGTSSARPGFGGASTGATFGAASTGATFGAASTGATFGAASTGATFEAASTGATFGTASTAVTFGTPSNNAVFGTSSTSSPFGTSEKSNSSGFTFGATTNSAGQGVFQFGTPNTPAPNFNAGPANDGSANAPRRVKTRYRRK